MERLITRHELWMDQAPSFNFELDEEQLAAKAIEKGFVFAHPDHDDIYVINQDWKPNSGE